MIFTPYPDEMEKINLIQRYNSGDYALLRLTFTMIDKNNLDANGFFRDILLQAGIVDYEALDHGGKNGKSVMADFILPGRVDGVKMNFYRVANARGDRRFSIESIRQKAKDQWINEGDLLYLACTKGGEGQPKVMIINLTHHFPAASDLEARLGVDDVYQYLEELRPKLESIVRSGYHDNAKGAGKISPKDVGDTLEALLGIETNNRCDADYKGRIEIKAKAGKTLDTLFTLRPCFEGTPIAAYEPNDRQRVSAFARYYGYESSKHPGAKSLYITIGSEAAPQNTQGFYLEVNEEDRRVELRRTHAAAKKSELTAFWTFSALKEELYRKHPATLWVAGKARMHGGIAQFQYEKILFSRSPQFTTFLTLIKEGVVTYDWRGYTSADGEYKGKNHGNAWRIKAKRKDDLFGTLETLAI